MDNLLVVRYLLETARALEYLDENPFKIQAYRRAARSIMELPVPVSEVVKEGGLSRVPGVGKGIASTIEAWVKDRDFSTLEELRAGLPRGIDELLKVPGIGLKRVRILHGRLGVETVDELMDALRQGRLAGVRTFPGKFVQDLPRLLEQVMSYRGKYLLSTGLSRADEVLSRLVAQGFKAELTGECRRFSEIVEKVEILVEGSDRDCGILRSALGEPGCGPQGDTLELPALAGAPPVAVRLVSAEDRAVRLLVTTGSDAHLVALKNHASRIQVEIEGGVTLQGREVRAEREEDIYRLLDLQYLPPEVREGRDSELARARAHTVPELLDSRDIRGTIHNHTDLSDGVSSLAAMVRGARERGYQWIGISDHSQSAHYAGGLSEEAVARQHREIDALEEELGDIAIFRGIESDILADGSLDYPPEVLEAFDFVIASIHSHMDMDRRRMTRRIVKALRNPFTTILAHPTGRLLLSREPYDVDMDEVLEEALLNRVAVELNANPMRFDLDWRLMDPFVSRGGIIAIGPDAHSVAGLDDMTYGIMMARKGFVTKESCLNTRDARGVREWFRKA
ncbi:MAG: PHP domain-containing protein [Desulfomonilia bacterium]|nr:PHP domain-containing protein [Desulfomonilia bacterium]